MKEQLIKIETIINLALLILTFLNVILSTFLLHDGFIEKRINMSG